jgi:hypothetical protein
MEAHQDIAQEARGGGLRPAGARSHPFRRFATIGARHGGDTGYLERTEAELALLREENARLRMERAQRPDAGTMIERLRSLSSSPLAEEDVDDEAWHLFTEALVMRDVLIDVCKEIGQTAITLQTRLGELTPDLPEQGAAEP